MSILPGTAGETSTMFKQIIAERLGDIEWPGYINARQESVEHQAERTEKILKRKRIEALRYLGNKIQNEGYAYNKTEPSIFTPEFVHALGEENSLQRKKRNPWLGKKQKMSRDSSEKAWLTHANILAFGPQITVGSDQIISTLP
ncbi:hypothetical protein ACFQPC_09085 [Herminiimonas glaciei]|uniref:Uncharacterized protein n=1 Tax=Herminiimonas glaciei TaxID=523788 RepID=A0ABW2IBE8_9BURK